MSNYTSKSILSGANLNPDIVSSGAYAESKTQTKLESRQKEAVGLLSIGTFLEYFDLMLYVHMAVILNELFFPKTDPYTAQLLGALAFCSTFIFRPLGALIFGWIGDNIGRRATLIITTLIMAGCCAVMAMLPTYAHIGIAASVIMIMCRITQGMACMGELVGAEIYLTENIKPPVQYPAVGLINIASSLGSLAALGVAYIVTLPVLSQTVDVTWRAAFGIGALVAIIGTAARSSLKESSDFIKAREEKNRRENDSNYQASKIEKKTLLAYFFIQCARPLGFYFIYTYPVNLLQDQFSLGFNDTFAHNAIIALVDLCGVSFLVFLSSRIYPIKIIKAVLALFLLIMVPVIFFTPNINTITELMTIQILAALLWFDHSTAIPVFYRHFPLLKRFTAISFVYAVSRAVMYGGIPFATVFLTAKFGNRGLLLVVIPVAIGFYLAVNHFKKLEVEAGYYPHQ